MLRAAVTTEGLQGVFERLGAFSERAKNMAPALRVVADLLEAHVAEQFRTQGARGGVPWAPLAASTVEARSKRWGYYRLRPTGGVTAQGPPLVWTGRLRRGFGRGSREHVRRVSATELLWGSLVPYAQFHQRRRPMVAFRDPFQQREIVFQPLRLWVQGVPEGTIRTVMAARTRLPLRGAV